MTEALKKLPVEGEVFLLDGHTAFVIPPGQEESDKGGPWAWYAPTLPGLPGPEEAWMFEQFQEAGIAIAGIDVGESYGNPAGRAVYTRLYEELVHKRGLSRKACLLMRSRGGLMLYNWAAEHPTCVACAAGIYPVCNLRSWPGLTTASTAYCLTERQLEAELAHHNPIDRLEGLASERVPIMHIHGDRDTMVPLEENSAELARRYRGLGGSMHIVLAEGHGHDMWEGFFRCRELVQFVLAHARAE